MKKVKLMLLSFCVLTVVAGALAFKAKGTLDYCTAPTHTTGDACRSTDACSTEGTTLTTNNPDIFVCTTAPDQINGCTGKLCGTTSAHLHVE